MRKMLRQAFFLCLITLSNAIRFNLTGNDWTIVDSNMNYTAKGSVPGTVHTILLTSSQIPDPYVGQNDINLRDLIKRDWIFTKNFSLPSEILDANETSIHLDQIDTVANITINKCLIGKVDNMFRRYIFPIPQACLHADNQIQIDFQSPVGYALQQSIAYNATVPPSCPSAVQNGECHVNFIRKEPCSFSWGWGPAFAPIGITRDIYLEAVNNTDIVIELETVNLISFDQTKKEWKVNVMLSSINEKFDARLRFTLENTSFIQDYNDTFDRNLTITLNIPENEVERWWPNGYGEQPLYLLSVSNDGQIIDKRWLGFRTVELIEKEYGASIHGLSFYFSINSQPIFIKGSNWIPSDAFQERVDDTKFERLLRSAQLANMNMLRVWGGGIYERREFYELADRLGIMLWHDFMFACSLYPVNEDFLSNVREEIIYQVKRLQHHPSIVLWSGNNENEWAIAANWYSIPAEQLNQTKADYRKLYVDIVLAAVKEIDIGNNRPFVVSSPSNGKESIAEDYIAANPQDPLYGDVHFYEFTNDPWNISTYPIIRFLSETGIQSLPSLDSWNQITSNQSDLVFNSSLLIYREHEDNQLNDMLTYIQSNLPLPVTNDPMKKFTQMIYLSQIHQAITLKSISDVCRIHSSENMIDPKTSQGHTMGIMYWQINDIWQAPTWSTIEYGLKWKLSHYYVRHMYAPIYPVITLTPYLSPSTDESANISLYIINDLYENTRGELICGVYALDSFTSRFTFGGDVVFSAPGVQTVMNIQHAKLMKRTSCTDPIECIIHCSFINSETMIGQTLLLNRPKNYQLSNPNLKIQSVTSTSPNDFNIVITADRPALFVWLDVPSNINGYFSRNGFHMFEPVMNISFHSWDTLASLNPPSVISLYDVTQA